MKLGYEIRKKVSDVRECDFLFGGFCTCVDNVVSMSFVLCVRV